MSGPLINRVAKSGIITINLEHFYPEQEIISFDLKSFLFMEMILKEKDFRASLKEIDWSEYSGKIVLVHCSANAIIPVWAYMLVSTYLEPVADTIYTGDQDSFLTHYYQKTVENLDITPYTEKRIVIKGCSDKPVPAGAYQALTKRLKPHVLSIMYGEPCSTVPIYKRPKA